MQRILDIAQKDIVQVLRDRLSFLFLLIMPVVFTLMFAFAFGGLGSKPAGTQKLSLGYLDLDGSPASAGLRDLLSQSASFNLETGPATTRSALEGRVADGKLAAAVIVPVGYGAALQTGGRALPGANPTLITASAGLAGLMARGPVQTAVNRVQSAASIGRIVAQSGGLAYSAAFNQALSGWDNPPVKVESTTLTNAGPQNNPALLQTSQTAPGMMIQFGMAGLITAAQVVVSERKTRCLTRMLTAPVRRWQVLAGHFLAMLSIMLAQFILLIAFGQLALGLNYLAQPLATLAMVGAVVLFLAGLGLLIGAVAKTEDQAVLFAMIPMFVFSGLGGAWMPLEATGQAFQAIGHFTPVAWAMDGFKAILVHGQGLAAVGLPAVILLGYALLFGGLAVALFRYDA